VVVTQISHSCDQHNWNRSYPLPSKPASLTGGLAAEKMRTLAEVPTNQIESVQRLKTLGTLEDVNLEFFLMREIKLTSQVLLRQFTAIGLPAVHFHPR